MTLRECSLDLLFVGNFRSSAASWYGGLGWVDASYGGICIPCSYWVVASLALLCLALSISVMQLQLATRT